MLVSLVNKEAEEKASALKRVEEAVATTDKVVVELKEVREAFAALEAEKEEQSRRVAKLMAEKAEEAQKALARDRDVVQLQSDATEQEHVRGKLEAALVQAQGEIESQRVVFIKLEEERREEVARAGMRDEELRASVERV